jgi:hypothetical protein
MTLHIGKYKGTASLPSPNAVQARSNCVFIRPNTPNLMVCCFESNLLNLVVSACHQSRRAAGGRPLRSPLLHMMQGPVAVRDHTSTSPSFSRCALSQTVLARISALVVLNQTRCQCLSPSSILVLTTNCCHRPPDHWSSGSGIEGAHLARTVKDARRRTPTPPRQLRWARVGTPSGAASSFT